jgi:hypothetical protein
MKEKGRHAQSTAVLPRFINKAFYNPRTFKRLYGLISVIKNQDY